MTDTPDKPLVFVVDDDEIILRSLRIALARSYQVQTCSSSVRGLVEIRNSSPHVILLDIKMPERDGFWLFREIRKFNTDVPIIFNSAYQDRIASADVGGTFAPFGVLPKTGRLDDLLDLVDRAVRSNQR